MYGQQQFIVSQVAPTTLNQYCQCYKGKKILKKFVAALKNRLIGRKVYRGILFIVHIRVYKNEIKSISFRCNNYYNCATKTSKSYYPLFIVLRIDFIYVGIHFCIILA